jgi:hypothetical protein
MTSAISYSAIDETYPIAGQDNNSQGFRDNFSYIKSGLTVAATEISALQTNTAKLNADNDFGLTVISNAETNQLYGSVYPVGTTTSNSYISVKQGEYQTFTIGNPETPGVVNITFTFHEWPASDLFAKIRVAFNSNGVAQTILFANSGGGTVKADDSGKFASGASKALTIPADATKTVIIEAWTINGVGGTVYLKYLGEFS